MTRLLLAAIYSLAQMQFLATRYLLRQRMYQLAQEPEAQREAIDYSNRLTDKFHEFEQAVQKGFSE